MTALITRYLRMFLFCIISAWPSVDFAIPKALNKCPPESSRAIVRHHQDQFGFHYSQVGENEYWIERFINDAKAATWFVSFRSLWPSFCRRCSWFSGPGGKWNNHTFWASCVATRPVTWEFHNSVMWLGRLVWVLAISLRAENKNLWFQSNAAHPQLTLFLFVNLNWLLLFLVPLSYDQ